MNVEHDFIYFFGSNLWLLHLGIRTRTWHGIMVFEDTAICQIGNVVIFDLHGSLDLEKLLGPRRRNHRKVDSASLYPQLFFDDPSADPADSYHCIFDRDRDHGCRGI